MKKENYTAILEFEVINPTGDGESTGDKYTLNFAGEYANESGTREMDLIFFLDHPAHYKASKIVSKGQTYLIPSDRQLNWMPEIHPDKYKFRVRDKKSTS